MQLLQIQQSKITYLTVVRRPEGQLFLPFAIKKLVEHYSFGGAPKSIEQLQEPPVAFQHGVFNGTAIDKVEIYNDGIVVSGASNTNVFDAFLDDLFSWIGPELGLTEVPQLRHGRIFESAVVAELAINPDKVAPWSRTIRSLIGEKWEAAGRPKFEFEFSQLRFGPDPHERTFAPINFSLERRAGIPFEQNIYFSTAPLRTDDHVEVLRAIEKALA